MCREARIHTRAHTDRSASRQADRSTGRQADVQAGGQAHRQVAKCTVSKETYRLVGGGCMYTCRGWQADRQESRRSTCRQAGRHTCRHADLKAGSRYTDTQGDFQVDGKQANGHTSKKYKIKEKVKTVLISYRVKGIRC
jgi:hypothetical protein